MRTTNEVLHPTRQEELNDIFIDVYRTYEEAKFQAIGFFYSDIWKLTTEGQKQNRDRWFSHGQDEARLALIYVMHFRHEMPEDIDLSALFLGMFIHDIGKVTAVDDPLVWTLPRAQISDHHWSMIIDHVRIGEEMLQEYEQTYGVHISSTARNIVRFHHEKIDGSGKPYGLSGGTILYEVRLATIIDQIIGRCEARAYHDKHYTLQQALEDVEIGKGRAYDEQILQNMRILFSNNHHMGDYGVEWLGVWESLSERVDGNVDNLGI